MIRPATERDRLAFYDLAKAYIAESGQGREYCEHRTQDALIHALSDPFSMLLVVQAEVEDGEPVYLAGGVLAQLDHAFTTKPVCIVPLLYVREEYRGTPMARALMEAVCSWADAAGCTHTFASANADVGELETQMFVNLCAKFGFTPAGSPVLSRRNPHHG